MNFKIWLESKEQPIIVYHGTAVENLPAILSQGLVPDSSTRTWANDPDTSFSSPSRQSLKGVYVTTNLITASSSAFNTARKFDSTRGEGRKKLFVVAQIKPRSMVADEDDVGLAGGTVSQSDYVIGQLYLALKTNKNPELLRDEQEKYITRVIESMQNKLKNMHPKLISRLRQLLQIGFVTAVERQAAYLHDSDFNRAKSYYAGSESVKKPDRQAAEKNYQDHIENLTRTMKNLSQPSKRDESTMFSFTGRIEHPIRYTGDNKIIAIVKTWDDISTRKTKAEVVYGKVPPKFIDDWNRSIGPWEESEGK